MTAFEKKVYGALKKIPRGSVTTYGELARRIGHPRAGRAVGNALNKNPFAPAVPCHRVVRADGKLAGYRWGLKRKRQLLDREASHAARSRG